MTSPLDDPCHVGNCRRRRGKFCADVDALSGGPLLQQRIFVVLT